MANKYIYNPSSLGLENIEEPITVVCLCGETVTWANSGHIYHDSCGKKMYLAVCPYCQKGGMWMKQGVLSCSCGESFFSVTCPCAEGGALTWNDIHVNNTRNLKHMRCNKTYFCTTCPGCHELGLFAKDGGLLKCKCGCRFVSVFCPGCRERGIWSSNDGQSKLKCECGDSFLVSDAISS